MSHQEAPSVTEEIMPDRGAFSSIRANPFFGSYLAALIISMTGSWIRMTALGFIVYDLTNDPLKLGLVNFANSLPQILLAPVSGALIDRLDRRKVLIGVQIVLFLNMVVLTSIIAMDRVTYPILLGYSVVLGAMMAFDWPARLSIVPQLVRRRDLANAAALNASVFNASKTVGPMIGGWIIAAFGVVWAFGSASVAILPFLVMVLTMGGRLRAREGASDLKEPPFQALKNGYVYIWRHERLRALLSVDLVPIVIGMGYIAMAPAIAKDVLHMDSRGLGLIMALNGIGSLIGTLIVARISHHTRRGTKVLLGLAGFALSLITFGLSGWIWLILLLGVFIGACYSFASTLNDALIQTTVDDAYRGRVYTVYSTFWGFSPAGALLAGWLANHVGVQLAIAVTGVLVLAYVPWLWLKTPMRSID